MHGFGLSCLFGAKSSVPSFFSIGSVQGMNRFDELIARFAGYYMVRIDSFLGIKCMLRDAFKIRKGRTGLDRTYFDLIRATLLE
jgi:hypothetical protein